MKVNCPGCKAEFAVADNRIPPQGMQVRCPKCFKSIEVETESGFGTDLEQALGIDLSGPGDGDQAPPITVAHEAPEPPPGSGERPVEHSTGSGNRDKGSDWPGLEDLNTKDISMIGTYQKVEDKPVAADDVWGGAGQPQQQGQAEAPPDESTAPDGLGLGESLDLGDDADFSGGDFDEALPTSEHQGLEPEATAPSGSGGVGEISFDDFDDPAPAVPAPAVPAPVAPVSRPEVETSAPERPFGTPKPRLPEPEQSAPVDGPDFGDFEFSDEALDSSGATPPVGAVPSGSGDDAPDSIFALEEASGVFDQEELANRAQQSQTGDTVGLAEGDKDPFATSGLDGGGFGDFEREMLGPTSGGAILEEDTLGGVSPPRPEKAPPGGGPTLDDIDFASLLDEVPGGQKQEEELFFVDSPSVPETQFETPKAPDAFSMEEIGLDELDDIGASLGGGGGDSGGGGGSGAIDDLFDLDMGDDMSAAIPSLDSSQASMGQAGMAGTQPAASTTPRHAPRRRKKGGMGILVILVVIVGAGLGAWQLGLLDDLFGTNKPKEVLKNKTEKKKLEFETRLLAAPSDYFHRFELLGQEAKIRQEAKSEIQEEMMWELAWYRFLFPDSFEKSKESVQGKFASQYEAYKKSHAGNIFKLKLEAMDLAAGGDWVGGRRAFQEYAKLKGSRMEQLLEKGKFSPQMAREDNLLAAWFAVMTGNVEKAAADLKELTSEKQGELYPTLLMARLEEQQAVLFAKAEDPEKAGAARRRAIDKLKELTDQFPQHSGAKLMLAQLYGEEGEFDQAIPLAADCLERGKEAGDISLQLKGYRSLAGFLSQKADKKELLKLLEEMSLNLIEKKAVEEEPEDLLLMLCNLYVEQGMIEKALGPLEHCKSCQSPDYYLLLGQAYARGEMYANALLKAKAGNDKYPRDTRLLFLLADLARKDGQINSSVAYLEQVLRIKPDDTSAALTLARLFLELKDPGNARRVLLEAERYSDNSLELEQMLAQINEAMGDDVGTVAALTRLLELQDDDNVRTKLVRFLVKQGNYSEALKHFEVLQGRGLITPELRQDYAKSLKAMGRIQEAVDVLKQLLKENPGDLETARFLSEIYLQKEDFFNAKIFLEAARRADTTDPTVHFLIGKCCLKLQDDECAMEGFQQAVALDAQKLEYRVEFANLLFKMSRDAEGKVKKKLLGEARKNFDYIIARYENDVTIPKAAQSADVYFNRGTVLFETGHFNDALRDLGKAMARAQHRYDILVAYADTLYKMNRYDEAVKYYDEMLDSKVEVAHAYFFLGKIHLFKGKREQAKGYLLKCIAHEPREFPQAHRHLGDIFKEKGLRKKARDHYKTYLELVGDKGLAAEDVKNALKKL